MTILTATWIGSGGMDMSGQLSQKTKFRECIDKISRIFNKAFFVSVATLWLFTAYLERFRWHWYVWTMFAKTKFRKYRRNFATFRYNSSLVYLDRFRRRWLEPAPHFLLPDEKVECEGGAAQRKFCKYRRNFAKFHFNSSLIYLDRFRRGWLEPAPHLLLPDEKVEGEGGAAPQPDAHQHDVPELVLVLGHFSVYTLLFLNPTLIQIRISAIKKEKTADNRSPPPPFRSKVDNISKKEYSRQLIA